MGIKKILVIDDEKLQAQALASGIQKSVQNSEVMYAYDETDIRNKVCNAFYNLLILDIRMDNYGFNGIDLAKMAQENNPFAKIIFVSRFLSEYFEDINKFMVDGALLGFSAKEDYEKWIPQLSGMINDYYDQLSSGITQVSDALISYYSEAKNELDTYKKGERFEHFITLLFSNIGYKEIQSRVKDAALNEVDLIIRNDIDDAFLTKLGNYFFIECKNKPEENTNKNDIILFGDKLSRSKGMAKLGFLFTTSTITKNSIVQLAKMDKDDVKIVIVDNVEIVRLITAQDMREQMKKVIDSQVHKY